MGCVIFILNRELAYPTDDALNEFNLGARKGAINPREHCETDLVDARLNCRP
jgi:hypothetical protein